MWFFFWFTDNSLTWCLVLNVRSTHLALRGRFNLGFFLNSSKVGCTTWTWVPPKCFGASHGLVDVTTNLNVNQTDPAAGSQPLGWHLVFLRALLSWWSFVYPHLLMPMCSRKMRGLCFCTCPLYAWSIKSALNLHYSIVLSMHGYSALMHFFFQTADLFHWVVHCVDDAYNLPSINSNFITK